MRNGTATWIAPLAVLDEEKEVRLRWLDREHDTGIAVDHAGDIDLISSLHNARVLQEKGCLPPVRPFVPSVALWPGADNNVRRKPLPEPEAHRRDRPTAIDGHRLLRGNLPGPRKTKEGERCGIKRGGQEACVWGVEAQFTKA